MGSIARNCVAETFPNVIVELRSSLMICHVCIERVALHNSCLQFLLSTITNLTCHAVMMWIPWRFICAGLMMITMKVVLKAMPLAEYLPGILSLVAMRILTSGIS